MIEASLSRLAWYKMSPIDIDVYLTSKGFDREKAIKVEAVDDGALFIYRQGEDDESNS